jgi:hypothetical protein
MHGPGILARTLTLPTRKGKLADWQYHPRSDHHSKVACWGILFDLLQQSKLLRDHVESGRLAFGINQEMKDFRSGRKKNLDLVLARPLGHPIAKPLSFRSLVGKWSIVLDDEELRILSELPDAREHPVSPITVQIALEAKACMTEHLKARPRLYDELNSSHDAVHGSAQNAIAAAFVMINVADWFVSPEMNKSGGPRFVTHHKQPRATTSVIEKVLEIPRRVDTSAAGFDALAIVIVDCVNDGSTPVRVVSEEPAPQPGNQLHYDSMIARVVQLYESRFPLA